MKIAIATCCALPEPDPDAPLLEAALARAGADVVMLPWDGDDDPARDAALVVLRSTWNYYRDLPGFLTWLDRTAARARVLNPPAIARWNVDKRYLRDLEARGVAIVPTVFVDRGPGADLGRALDGAPFDAARAPIVIKPTVSAASFNTRRFAPGAGDEARAFLRELARERDVMIQPYMEDVEAYGERSLVFVDGALSHAIRKSPRLAGGDESVSAAQPIADDERAFAERALAPMADDLLYARVDVVRDPSGALRIMELELLEPSLFLLQRPEAADRLAQGIVRRAREA